MQNQITLAIVKHDARCPECKKLILKDAQLVADRWCDRCKKAVVC